MDTGFSILFISLLIISTSVQLYLALRQIGHVRRHRDAVPEAFAASVPLDAHRKAADYTHVGMRFGLIELICGALLLVFWTLGSGLQWLDAFWRGLAWSPVPTGVAFILSFFLLSSLIDLPFSLYRTFGIEQRFGFNRTTLKLYLIDLLKQSVLMLVLGIPLAAVVLWLMQHAGARWWLYVWMVWMGFNLLMLWAYPTLIAPLFNKFSPLDDDSLRERIEKLLTRTGFASKGLFVMDGSLRSAHGNAYFTGFGKAKRIVFFDTLLKELDPPEVEAVLAHELGHFKRKHVTKQIVLMACLTLPGLALLAWLADQPWFYQGLGVSTASLHAALVLFMVVIPSFTFFVRPLASALSRKFEFEADNYAAGQVDGKYLISSLVKLYRENARTLTPDPLYSAFYDSHPPPPVRVAHVAGL